MPGPLQSVIRISLVSLAHDGIPCPDLGRVARLSCLDLESALWFPACCSWVWGWFVWTIVSWISGWMVLVSPVPSVVITFHVMCYQLRYIFWCDLHFFWRWACSGNWFSLALPMHGFCSVWRNIPIVFAVILCGAYFSGALHEATYICVCEFPIYLSVDALVVQLLVSSVSGNSSTVIH